MAWPMSKPTNAVIPLETRDLARFLRADDSEFFT